MLMRPHVRRIHRQQVVDGRGSAAPVPEDEEWRLDPDVAYPGAEPAGFPQSKQRDAQTVDGHERRSKPIRRIHGEPIPAQERCLNAIILLGELGPLATDADTHEPETITQSMEK